MKTVILFASICVASGLLFVNIYTSLIDANSWGSNIPDSIAAAREYFKTVNPGNFFRIFSPINQLLGLVVLIIFWKSNPSVRPYLGITLLMYLVAEGMTFGYFYPRNAILFNKAQLADIDLLKRTVEEWKLMNWVRSFVLVVGLFFAFLSVNKIYSR